MSVASRNPFELLGDEGGDTTPSVAAPSSQTASKETPTAETPGTRGGANQRGRGPASRGGRYYQRGGASKSAPRDAAADSEDALREGKRNVDDARGRGRGRGKGDRGAKGGRGRPFDKHSQSGKTDSDKKLHQGWGGDEGKTELKAEVDASKDVAAETTPLNDWANDGAAPAADDGWGLPADSSATTGATTGDAAAADAPTATTGAPESRRNREEEEDNTLTLDQYLAQQKEKNAVPKTEVRKPNEGTDDSLWKDVIQLSRSEQDAYFVGKTKSTPKQRSKAHDKVYLEIDAHFERPQRGGRGGRGEGRGVRGGNRGRGGGGGRGRGRGDYQGANGASTAQVDVDDQSAFPSLS